VFFVVGSCCCLYFGLWLCHCGWECLWGWNVIPPAYVYVALNVYVLGCLSRCWNVYGPGYCLGLLNIFGLGCLSMGLDIYWAGDILAPSNVYGLECLSMPSKAIGLIYLSRGLAVYPAAGLSAWMPSTRDRYSRL
jgi:hypothetical protein